MEERLLELLYDMKGNKFIEPIGFHINIDNGGISFIYYRKLVNMVMVWEYRLLKIYKHGDDIRDYILSKDDYIYIKEPSIIQDVILYDNRHVMKLYSTDEDIVIYDKLDKVVKVVENNGYTLDYTNDNLKLLED